MNEPELVEAVNRLRGEWAERFGGRLTASATTWEDFAGRTAIDADVIIFPSRYLGELCVRDWLRPVRAHVLEGPDFDAADVFPLVRHELIRWGGEVMALPLGIHWPAKAGLRAPPSAISLLAEAAPDAVSERRLGALFNPETMEPRIAEPPFVDALATLAQPNQHGDRKRSAGAVRVPVIGFADRLAAVTTTSRNAASAFRLLGWLASAEISSQLAPAGDGTMPVRRSLATSPAWYDPSLAASERADLGKTLEAELSQPQCLLIPRIPGVDDYLAALDQAVHETISGDAAPQAALKRAAERWEEVTAAHGRDAQRQAYLQHLGISEP